MQPLVSLQPKWLFTFIPPHQNRLPLKIFLLNLHATHSIISLSTSGMSLDDKWPFAPGSQQLPGRVQWWWSVRVAQTGPQINRLLPKGPQFTKQPTGSWITSTRTYIPARDIAPGWYIETNLLLPLWQQNQYLSFWVIVLYSIDLSLYLSYSVRVTFKSSSQAITWLFTCMLREWIANQIQGFNLSIYYCSFNLQKIFNYILFVWNATTI